VLASPFVVGAGVGAAVLGAAYGGYRTGLAAYQTWTAREVNAWTATPTGRTLMPAEQGAAAGDALVGGLTIGAGATKAIASRFSAAPSNATVARQSTSTIERIQSVSQQGFDYAVQNPRKAGLTRMQLGKDAEIQATRWLRRWAERTGVDLGEGGLRFQVRGAHSVPDVVFDPARQILDFKLTPKAVRPVQTQNFLNDFPGYSVEYVFGPGPWRTP